jgi:hypothetical protein
MTVFASWNRCQEETISQKTWGGIRLELKQPGWTSCRHQWAAVVSTPQNYELSKRYSRPVHHQSIAFKDSLISTDFTATIEESACSLRARFSLLDVSAG